ncbi:putative helicase mov-10-B.1 isoform X2 [Diabrotica virgifera virgifera]|uniref:RNA helicase n=1 Tax=Diabrotica virgifera virgifera TaxID=50390 RepID=A0ABM5KM92_DIAVI|nr:putative helicase mov-10-B.1 isoform X2 [Diabrotica virgifera virgifera]
MAAPRNQRGCPVCPASVEHDEHDGVHNNSIRHRLNYLLKQWHIDRKSLVKNRHGAEVTIKLGNASLVANVNNGKHYYKITLDSLRQQGNVLDFTCTATNRRRDDIFLTRVLLLCEYEYFSIFTTNENITPDTVVQLMPNTNHQVMVRFSPDKSIVGGYNIPVCFNFQTNNRQTFSIIRSINISVEETIEENEQYLTSPFTGNPWWDVQHILPPTGKSKYSDRYAIPESSKRFYFYGLQEFQDMRREDLNHLRELQRQMQPGEVTRENFKKFWHNVLWIEEIGQTLGIQQYNMENVSLDLLDNELLKLEVPGLAEKRPSLIVGDMVQIRAHIDHTGYTGIIRRVTDSTVEIGNVNRELIMIIESQSEVRDIYDVKFVLSRLSFERQHQGVDQVSANGLLPCIFPSHDATLRGRQTERIINDGEFLNQTIARNQEQKTAVRNILNATSVPYPYIVFGPPGTGKTVTIVEAILQLKFKTTHNILVCAPSNAACDLITEKLLEHCTTNELIRVMSSTVDLSNVHEPVLRYSNYEEYEGSWQYKKMDSASLKTYRIVVITLIHVGIMGGYYKPDVVFVDEAAQACEPEVCIALGMVKHGQQIVLAGDPKQLGPSLTSDSAIRYGLGISLLERIMQTELYHQHNQRCITMLIQNFRNHPKILTLPNELFYGDQLQAQSQRSLLDPLATTCVFQKLQEMYSVAGKKNSHPKFTGDAVEFCSLLSKEQRQGKSPSYFNVKEAQMVIKYIRALQALEFLDEEDKVKPSDIGIVTPYARQVYTLKALLKGNQIEGVDVGTTETFQGREKRIIIISTVRAQKDLLLYDKLYKLGFVKNEKNKFPEVNIDETEDENWDNEEYHPTYVPNLQRDIILTIPVQWRLVTSVCGDSMLHLPEL